MTATVEINDSRIELRGEWTIFHATECQDALAKLIAHLDNLELTLEQVTEIDTSGVQLLLCTKRHADAHGKPFAISTTSPGAAEVLDLYNLRTALNVQAGQTNNSLEPGQ